ncbi:outer membrane autotransporter protein [Bosea sp. BE125]|uniref:autotransporter outer membrane beta-barrel domain-containing protein n=1 Tax=Bosea sp. BE125 TaxID=2817909 RepID=UPI00285D9179|nr:autotransporter domain-containing protein [Bosea sp. BE125]MDR6872175.1 outer membrane autotransporter protein [Bosea sp. BE125]
MTYIGNARLLAGASCVALALVCSLSAPSSAATYFVSNATELQNAIIAANGNADANSTILMTQSFEMLGTPSLPTATKNLTIDTNGFVLLGTPVGPAPGTPGSVNVQSPASGNILTLAGTLVGSAQGGGIGVGAGLVIDTGAGITAQVVNNGSITGGATTTARGGIGVSLLDPTTAFTNNGTINGGANNGGVGIGGGPINNGAGLNMPNGGTAINTITGTIQGGNAQEIGSAGAGVYMSNLGAPTTLTNFGTVRGGSSTASGGSAAVLIEGSPVNIATINNFGTIEGGNGLAAIVPLGFTANIRIVNGGTIRAGAGSTIAIQFGSSLTSVASLELQAGSQIIGNVVASGPGTSDTLRLGGTANASFDVSAIGAQYQNFDVFEKTGASTWTLTGTGSFTGPTNLIAGTLSVNGSLAGSALTVQSGATLAGSGTVGATTLLAGSRITPGNSIGTLTINGAYVQAAGSTYQVEVDPATTTSDLIRVNGAATLASGAGLSVVNYTGAPYLPGQRFTILTSTGLTGSYALSDQVLTPFLNLRDSYDAANAYLTVIQTRTVASAASTSNQAEVGRSVDSLPSGNPVQIGVINQPTLGAARTALNQLSGEIHASAKTALIDESRLLSAAVTDRLRAAFGGVGAAPMATLNYGFTADLAPSVKGPMPTLNADRFAVWGQGYGAWGRSGSDGNAARLTRSTGGFLLGTDAALFDTLRIGAVAGYSRSTFDLNARRSSGESDNYHLGLYAGGQWGALGFRTGASYTWHEIETRRTVVFSGFGDSLRSDYTAGTAQLFGELGYRIDLGRVAFEPFAGLAYVNLHTDGLNETGGAAALSARGDDTSLGYSTLGLRASTNFALQAMDLTLRGGLAWRHAFGEVNPTTTLAFAGSGAFSVTGIPIARDATIVEAGLDLAIGKSATLGLSYTGQLAQDTQDHAFKGVLAVRF